MPKLQLRTLRPHLTNAAADKLIRIPVTPGNFAKLRLVLFNLDVDATVASRLAYLRQYKETTELSGSGIVDAHAPVAQTAGQDHHHTVRFGVAGTNFAAVFGAAAIAHGGSFEQHWDSASPIFEGEFTLAFGAESLQAGDAYSNVEVQYWDGPLDLVATAD